jgi:energy-coupling factor transporter transmembrane protein EcfT
VLEDSLERSIDLAASLESRGYGYFSKPTRYRPESWGLRETLAISGPLFIVMLLLYISNPGPMIIAPLFLAALTPAWAS